MYHRRKSTVAVRLVRWSCDLFPTQMPEEEAFCVLVQLMHSYKMRELYKPSMADLSLCFYQLDKLIEVRKEVIASCL